MADLEHVITEENFDTKNVVITDAKKQEKSLLRNVMGGAKMIAVSTFLATAPLSVDAQVVQSNAGAEITSVLQDGKEGESKEVTPPKEIDGIALTDEEKTIYINYRKNSLNNGFTTEELTKKAMRTVQRKRIQVDNKNLEASLVQQEARIAQQRIELEQVKSKKETLSIQETDLDLLIQTRDTWQTQIKNDKIIIHNPRATVAQLEESLRFWEKMTVPKLSAGTAETKTTLQNMMNMKDAHVSELKTKLSTITGGSVVSRSN